MSWAVTGARVVSVCFGLRFAHFVAAPGLLSIHGFGRGAGCSQATGKVPDPKNFGARGLSVAALGAKVQGEPDKRRMKSSEELDLLWAEASECWDFKSDGTHVQALTPVLDPLKSKLAAVAEKPSSFCFDPTDPLLDEIRELPKIEMPYPVIYGLTAYNPPGQDLPFEENEGRLSELRKDIALLINGDAVVLDPAGQGEAKKLQPKPSVVWHSYGFGREGWREDGCSIGFGEEVRAQAREVAVVLAQKYSQGAIYEFEPVAGTESRLLRRTTVPCDSRHNEEVTLVQGIEVPDDYTGQGWPSLIWHPHPQQYHKK